MTMSLRGRWGAALALALGLALGPGAARAQEGEPGPSEDVVQVISGNVGGKNVYIPSTIVVEAGKPAVLSVFNTTDTPHGFAIPAAKIEEILPVQEEHRVELPAMKEGIYRIHCQLHPAHRNGTLVVVEAAD